jgi:hypothetical protein
MLGDAVMATRQVSRAGQVDAQVTLENGRTETALGIQEKFHAAAVEALAGRDDETDWIWSNGRGCSMRSVARM